MSAKTQQKRQIIRMRLATVHILLNDLKTSLADEAATLKTGQLSNEQKDWEKESILLEMIQADTNAQIIEAVLKSFL